MAIVLIIILALLVLWFISTQRRLVAMDENINNAMSQIGAFVALGRAYGASGPYKGLCGA